jgi:hypothetical protein
MTTVTLLPAIVQSVCAVLTPVLPALVKQLGPERFLNTLDRRLAHSVLEGARCAIEQALSDAPSKTLQNDVVNLPGSRHYEIHSALGKLAFTRSTGVDRQGETVAGFDLGAVAHGCTWSVREECTFFLAQGTAQEALDALSKFRTSVPSVSTIKRVGTLDGLALMRIWDGQTATLTRHVVAPLADQIDLVSVSADGATVPMRGMNEAATREYREARLVTVTLFGAPDPTRERTVTLHTVDGEPYKECVGDQRPRLATLLFGDMPRSDGPKGDRAVTALGTMIHTIRDLVPGVAVRGVCDGGLWPETTLDEVLPTRHRTTDFYHATGHLHEVAELAFGDREWATVWYQRERTKLLTEDGAAKALVSTIEALAARPRQRITTHEALDTEAGFFRKRWSHMNYAALLRDDLPIGSGIVEAAVKQLISLRMKRTGATWSEEGGDAIIALRSLRLSGLWDEAWRLHTKEQSVHRQRKAA